MSIIQNIRDKYAKVAVVAIALALIGFILTDYFTGRGRNMFRGNGSNSVGSINGSSISFDEFKTKVDQTEESIKKQPFYQYQPQSPAMLTKNAVDQAWEEEISTKLMGAEVSKLGMRIGKKERGDILFGDNAPDFIKQNGTDPNTNQYDPVQAKRWLDQRLKDKRTTQKEKDDFNRYVDALDEFRLREKYAALFTNSINYPRWYMEKQSNDNAQIAKVSLVRMPYTDSSFVDSTIKISDKEIEDYVAQHKDKFKQEQKTRSISFVTISAAPTQKDSVDLRNQMAMLRPEFDTTKDVAGFMAGNGNPEEPNVYYSPTQLPRTGKDSIMRLAKNAVYGPYLEANSWVLVKMLDTKIYPDSVKARHILIKTYDPQTKQTLLDDSTAKKRIDSIDLAIKNGARFDSLAVKYSDDKGSAVKGGLLETPIYQGGPVSAYFTRGAMVQEFNDFCFDGKTGDKKVVKTIFGYHLIEILDQKNFQNNYKVAFLAKEILPSQQTDNDAQGVANNFFADSKDLKSFDEAYAKVAKPVGGLKSAASNITPLDAQIVGAGMPPIVSRSLVKSIYAAKLGEVLKPEKVDDKWIIAIVTEVHDAGVMSAAQARPTVEFLLRNKKKAELIKQKIGTVTTLEDVSAKLNKPIEVIDSLRMDPKSTSQKITMEPRVLGALFNPANKGKISEPIVGTNAVFVVRVENVGATPSNEGSVEDQRKAAYQNAKTTSGFTVLEGLRKVATIKDKRAERF